MVKDFSFFMTPGWAVFYEKNAVHLFYKSVKKYTSKERNGFSIIKVGFLLMRCE